MERCREEGEEMRGGELKLDSQDRSHIYQHLLFLYPSDNSLQKLGQESSTFYQQCVFQTSTSDVRSRKISTDYRQNRPLICNPVTVIRHPFHDMRIPLRFQPRGYNYLIPSPVMHLSGVGLQKRTQHLVQCYTQGTDKFEMYLTCLG